MGLRPTREWDGSPTACEVAKNYFDELNKRKEHEAETLADLTGWNLEYLIKKTGLPPDSQPKPRWQGIWGSWRAGRDGTREVVLFSVGRAAVPAIDAPGLGAGRDLEQRAGTAARPTENHKLLTIVGIICGSSALRI
jgi:hypothetical protein